MKKGDVFSNRHGDVIEVLSYSDYHNVRVRFIGEHEWENTLEKGQILNGEFKNYYKPNIHGVGFIGRGKYDSKTGGGVVYRVWTDMLRRCYSEKSYIKNPSYIGCLVEPAWHNFQNFAEWYVNHQFYGFGHELDKDLLVEGNKIYGEKYCTLLPKSLNSMLTSLKKKMDTPLPKGVRFDRNKYNVRLQIGGIRKSIGRFDSLTEAGEAYNKAKGESLYELADRYKEVITEESYLAILRLGNEIKKEEVK